MLQFLSGLLMTSRRSEERRMPARPPEGERVYAIGDIHGRSDLLKELLGKLKKDAKGFKGTITLVGIGDYIDRGPNSKGVVEMLRTEVPAGWGKVFLRGNHEQAMMDFLADPARTEWLAWGGIQALESYGICPFGSRGVRQGKALAAELEHELKDSGHGEFFDSTVLTHRIGDYLFVHAGVRRGIALEKQMPDDLLFIRDDFLGRSHGLPYRIVFGHTILKEPMVEDDRIGLDTGAFQSGVLTAVRLEGEDAKIIQAHQKS